MKPAIVEEERSRGCFKMGQKEKRPLSLSVRTCAQTQAASEQRCQLGVIKYPKTKSSNTSKEIIKNPKKISIPPNRIIKYPKTELSNIPKPNHISNTPKPNYQIPKTIIRYQSICCCPYFTKPHKIQSFLSKGCIHLHGPWEK